MPERDASRPNHDPGPGPALTYKQRLFVYYYLGESGGNATDAARRAGYACPDKAAAKLVVKGSIRAAIDARLNEVALSSEEILARLSEIATADLNDFLRIEGPEWSIDLGKARKRRKTGLIHTLKTGKFGPEIQLHDALKALDKLGQYRGLWKPDKKPDKFKFADLVAAAEQRATERKRERDGER